MLNMDFNESVVIDTSAMAWEASPMPGVWRKPLARAAAEHGHTTSIVRYDPGSSFSPHAHPLGEEILVLEGTFADDHGEYPAGTYLRNPPGSTHSPRSDDGCVLLVKLDQFDPEDLDPVRIDTRSHPWLPGEERLEIMLLHDFGYESVVLQKWPASARARPHQHFGGEEIFVVSGTLCDEYGEYPAGTWLRLPHCSEHCPYAVDATVVWLKTGHLLP